MKIGTRSVLFGVHQFGIHPWFVAWAWWQLYGFPWDIRLWVCFVLHDLGYIGKPNLDGKEGEEHPEWAARLVGRVFGKSWGDFCRYHSRFLAKRDNQPFSRLCVADKLAISLCPGWLYLPLARLTGELKEYMQGKGARTPAGHRSSERWYRDVQRYCREWAIEHADCRIDTWTGTKRDLADERALDDLLVLALRVDNGDEIDIEHLPELTDKEQAALDSLGPDFIVRLLSGDIQKEKSC